MAEKTNMTPEWISRVWQDNPCRLQKNGNILTGPVRLAFCNVLEPGKNKDGSEKGYGVVLLFPDLGLIGGPEALAVLQNARLGLIKEKMPAALANEALRKKLHNPFKDQGDFVDTKSTDGSLYEGFVAGRPAISANSRTSKPMVTDANLSPVIDKSEVFSGCWALVALNPGWIGRDDKKGPTFYLNGVMVIAKDQSLGGVGGPGNAKDLFEGVKIDGAVDPAAMFGDAGSAPAEKQPVNLFD